MDGGNHLVKTFTWRVWRHFWRIVLLIGGGGGRVFLWFFWLANVHRFKVIKQIRVDIDINILLFSDRHYASTGGYIFTDQPYLAVCIMMVATVWAVHSGFSILDLPKHHLLYVCDSFLPFFFSVLTSSLLPPPPGLQREVNSRSVFYSGHFHPKSARYTTLAGCR